LTFQSCPQIAVAVINGVLDTQPIANVLHFRKLTSITQGDIDNLATAVDTEWGANVLPHLHSTYAYVITNVRNLEFPSDLQGSSGAGAGAGGEGGDALPSNCAFVISLYSGLSGRSARGRTYIPAIPASKTATANTLDPTYVTTLVAGFATIKTLAATFGWDQCVLSRFSLGAARPTGIGYAIATIVARNDILDSQRNRLPAGH